MKRLLILLVLLSFSTVSNAQTSDRPLVLPMQETASQNTWLLGQPYGNTTGAFNFGNRWYSAGQGLHFGLDFSAPCGTPLVAVADGEVAFVDNLNFGSAPHNLILRHPELGLTSLYGHLQDTPDLTPGEQVTQGQVVAYSGDPDETCDSRPHLHFELRSADYRTTYNPVEYMDANWHSLALIGSYSNELFQHDLMNSRRWMSLDDQPDVQFGGRRLNDYQTTYPPPFDQRPPTNAPLLTDTATITAETTTNLRRIGYDACCWDWWWHGTAPDTFYTVDGAPGTLAMIFEWSADQRELVNNIGTAPRRFRSPDFSHEVLTVNDTNQIRRLSDGETWLVDTGGAIPALNPSNTRLLWQQQNGEFVPGQPEPQQQVFVSDTRGNDRQMLIDEQGINATWLDDNRLLLRVDDDPNTRLEIYDLTSGTRTELGTWYRPRSIRPAPGGDTIAMYLSGQANSGVYLINTRTGEQQRRDWFGAYRWRDDDSLFYIPFNPASGVHQLMHYDISSGDQIALTDPQSQPFTVMNGKWQVNADGSTIAFRNAADRNLWLIEIASTP